MDDGSFRDRRALGLIVGAGPVDGGAPGSQPDDGPGPGAGQTGESAMAVDESYQGPNYGEQDGGGWVVGGKLTVESTGELAIAAGGKLTAAGSQASAIGDIAVTYSSNDPEITPDGAITVADGSGATAAELLEFCEELRANQNAILAALRGVGIVASS